MPMSRLSLTLAAAAALCFSAGCSKKGMHRETSNPPMSASAQSTAAPSAKEQRCPMSVPGTQVQVQDTPDGTELVFTTSDPSQVSDLQMRARRMLQEQSERSNAESATDLANARDLGDSSTEIQSGRNNAGTGGAGNKGTAGAPTVPSTAVAQDTPNGITIIYTAQNEMQKRHLFDEVHNTARKLQRGYCPGL
ncbi:hypothetical protein [Corallococcus sp. EGB]|uniref:hypothetical protein n=1 Tax=Corallococcus sp. EGB TaxID=1521117 RepID=UPI001CC13440|nr:hypothetical protein [Corallococcus sp. EGB]